MVPPLRLREGLGIVTIAKMRPSKNTPIEDKYEKVTFTKKTESRDEPY